MVFVRAILPNEAVCWSPPPKVPVTYLSLKMSSSYCSGFWLCDYCLGTISMGCRISTASCWNRYSSVVGGGPSSTSSSAPETFLSWPGWRRTTIVVFTTDLTSHHRLN